MTGRQVHGRQRIGDKHTEKFIQRQDKTIAELSSYGSSLFSVAIFHGPLESPAQKRAVGHVLWSKEAVPLLLAPPA